MATTPYINQYDVLLSDSDDDSEQTTSRMPKLGANNYSKRSRRGGNRLAFSAPKMNLNKSTTSSAPKMSYLDLTKKESKKKNDNTMTSLHNNTQQNDSDINKSVFKTSTHDYFDDDFDKKRNEEYETYMDSMLDGYEYEIYMQEKQEREHDDKYYNNNYSYNEYYSDS